MAKRNGLCGALDRERNGCSGKCSEPKKGTTLKVTITETATAITPRILPYAFGLALVGQCFLWIAEAT
jgi:hypothetical protein